MGACRSNELYSMKLEDVRDLGSAFLVVIPNTKTKIVRKFTITDSYYDIVKEYLKKRHEITSLTCPTFFMNYQNGKCTKQRIGINKFGAMGKKIAEYLKIPSPELYTGHSFRRTSATILANAGADILQLKRHGGWKSNAVAEGYVDDSMRNKNNTASKIFNSIENNHQEDHPTISNTIPQLSTSHQNSEVSYNDNDIQITNLTNLNDTPGFHFTNCSNITLYNFK